MIMSASLIHLSSSPFSPFLDNLGPLLVSAFLVGMEGSGMGRQGRLAVSDRMPTLGTWSQSNKYSIACVSRGFQTPDWRPNPEGFRNSGRESRSFLGFDPSFLASGNSRP